MDKPTSGNGLITQILKTTEAVKYERPQYKVNPSMIQSRSDKELFWRLDQLVNKKKRTGNLNRKQARESRHIFKKMQERGLLTAKIKEDWPE